MVKKEVMLNLIALIILLSGFTLFIFKYELMSAIFIILGVIIYFYQKMVKV